MTVQPYYQPLSLRPDRARSSGIHLSGVLNYIATVTKSFVVYDEDLDALLSNVVSPCKGTPVRMAIGFAWEAWLAAQVEGLIWQPGEMSLDDVYGNPDGLDCNLVLHEFKSTHKSSRHQITEHKGWLWQGCGYLKMLQAQYGVMVPRTVVYHVLYLRGDYQGIDPVYRPESVTFEQGEIDSVWDMVLRNKDHANVRREE